MFGFGLDFLDGDGVGDSVDMMESCSELAVVVRFDMMSDGMGIQL